MRVFCGLRTIYSPPLGGVLDCFPLYAYFLRRLTAAVGRVTAILEGLP